MTKEYLDMRSNLLRAKKSKKSQAPSAELGKELFVTLQEALWQVKIQRHDQDREQIALQRSAGQTNKPVPPAIKVPPRHLLKKGWGTLDAETKQKLQITAAWLKNYPPYLVDEVERQNRAALYLRELEDLSAKIHAEIGLECLFVGVPGDPNESIESFPYLLAKTFENLEGVSPLTLIEKMKQGVVDRSEDEYLQVIRETMLGEKPSLSVDQMRSLIREKADKLISSHVFGGKVGKICWKNRKNAPYIIRNMPEEAGASNLDDPTRMSLERAKEYLRSSETWVVEPIDPKNHWEIPAFLQEYRTDLANLYDPSLERVGNVQSADTPLDDTSRANSTSSQVDMDGDAKNTLHTTQSNGPEWMKKIR